MNRRSRFLIVAIPEGAELSFPLAGGVSRFLAWIIDLLLVGALSGIIGQILAISAVFGDWWRQALTIVVYFSLSFGYPIFCEWRLNGQTIGKRLFRLRVMDIDARQLSLAQIVIRNLVRLVDMLPAAYLIGGLSATFGKYGQRLGDLSAGTVVVREIDVETYQVPDLVVHFNSFLQFPHLIARLRHNASRNLMRVAATAILRRDHLDPRARVELFDRIRSQFVSIVSFPESATEYLTSEQYVRNILAAVANR